MTIKAEPYTHDPLYSDRTYPEEKREYEKMYEATTGKVSHKILIELDDEAYNYWKQRAENEGRSMQSLIASMVCLFPKAKAVTDAFLRGKNG